MTTTMIYVKLAISMIRQLGGTNNHEVIRLHGIVTSGTAQSGFFTEIPWVRKQFIDKLGISPCPGTFNIAILAEDVEKLKALRKAKGIEIIPREENFCTANSFPALIGGRVKGAALTPLIANYPQTQLEIISTENIKQTLSLNDGDLVEVEVYL